MRPARLGVVAVELVRDGARMDCFCGPPGVCECSDTGRPRGSAVVVRTTEQPMSVAARRICIGRRRTVGLLITLGAMRAAHCIVVPTPLEMPELDGLEGLLREAADYPLLLVPNKVPYAPPAAGKRRLRELATHWNVAVGPVVSSYRALGQRQQRMAVSAIEPTPARWVRYVDELRLVADEVKRLAK